MTKMTWGELETISSELIQRQTLGTDYDTATGDRHRLYNTNVC